MGNEILIQPFQQTELEFIRRSSWETKTSAARIKIKMHRMKTDLWVLPYGNQTRRCMRHWKVSLIIRQTVPSQLNRFQFCHLRLYDFNSHTTGLRGTKDNRKTVWGWYWMCSTTSWTSYFLQRFASLQLSFTKVTNSKRPIHVQKSWEFRNEKQSVKLRREDSDSWAVFCCIAEKYEVYFRVNLLECIANSKFLTIDSCSLVLSTV